MTVLLEVAPLLTKQTVGLVVVQPGLTSWVLLGNKTKDKIWKYLANIRGDTLYFKECWAVMPWEQVELCSGVSAVIILNNRSPAHACQGVEGCQLCLCHMKVEPPAAVEKAVEEAVFEHGWYCTESEIFGRSNFHVGQQLFQK